MLRNYSLVALLLGILAYSATMTIVYIGFLAGVFLNVPWTLSDTAELTTHWVITYTYLSVAFDARMMVNA